MIVWIMVVALLGFAAGFAVRSLLFRANNGDLKSIMDSVNRASSDIRDDTNKLKEALNKEKK